ncbi:MAG: ATP-binding cassette domain-containing protein [Flavobacterium sp.]|nr:ATP-binding cassette domain-containing protein [Flavobacterium sp.]
MLSVKNISFSYTDKRIIGNVSFSIEKGKCLAVIGESGCGKSTLLQLVYGLHDLNQGSLFWNETEVLGPKFNLIPGMEQMKYLAQDFDLMPYITVAENVGKYLSNSNLKLKKSRITELLSLVEMEEFADTKAQFLSGGQMQRVAIARVLALEPELLLLDEPFSHIDTFRKNGLRRRVFSYLKEKEITCIVATHDSKDILSFSDETLVLRDGKVVTNGCTKSVYEERIDFYTASLFDDVNVISSSILGLKGEERTVYLFPYQLKVVSHSELKVTVVQSYFKGNGFLIESIFLNQKVFFENEFQIDANSEVYLEMKNCPH